MKNKSYDYIFGNGKFNTWFNIIVSIISCSAISFCLTELLFSFDFKVSFQKALIFTILFVIFLLLFYYFIKQRTYKLFDQKITYGFRERKILYADIHSLVFTLSSRPKGIYDTGRTIPIHKRKWEEKIYMQYYNLFGISKCYTKKIWYQYKQWADRNVSCLQF